MVFPRDVDVASFFSLPTRQPQGSLTKIEDLIKAYGTPVVSKVQEKYPAYMTTVDAKVRPRPSAASERTTCRFFTADARLRGRDISRFFRPDAYGRFFLSSLSRSSSTTSSRFASPRVARPSSRDHTRWTPL